MGAALVVGALVQLLACASFLFVARLLAKRTTEGREAGAVTGFIVWWTGMGIFMASRGTLSLLAETGWTPVAAFIIARSVEIFVLSVAAAGLTYYVAYLYTGRTASRVLAAAYYLIVGTAYLVATYMANPSEVRVSEWDVSLLPPPIASDVIYVFFGLPPLLASAAYLSLVARPIQPIQRYRVVLVSVSVLGWVGSGLAATLARDALWSFVAITVLGIASAGAVFLAYRPPGFVRLRLSPNDPDIAEARRQAALRAERFRERAAQLI